MTETLTELCRRLEHFVTPAWAADEILKREILAGVVVDPCCGTGVLGDAARRAGYDRIRESDIHDWQQTGAFQSEDFLNNPYPVFVHPDYPPFSVFMNPPFSLAVEFVKRSFRLGARKVVCFQRFAFWESNARKEFWDEYPPTKVYICGDRADCWRHDLPINDRGRRFDPLTGRELAGSPTAHAWFIFEAGHKGGTSLERIYKNRV